MDITAVLSIISLKKYGYLFHLELPTLSWTSPQQTLHPPAEVIASIDLDLDLHSTIEAEIRNLRLQIADSQPLERLGRLLFNRLLPTEIKNTLRQLPSELPLIIATDETELPWELLHDGEEYLALKHPLSRRLFSTVAVAPNPGLPQSKPSFLFIVNPEKNLPQTDYEIENLLTICDAAAEHERIKIKILARERAFKTAAQTNLAGGEYNIIHYSGHAKPGALILADGDLTAEEISKTLSGHPFVFLNACRSARETTEPVAADVISPYTGPAMHDLASAFITGGALAFVGTLWEVFDASSRLFAERFYTLALDGISVGEALRQTRVWLKQHLPDDPIWASFVFYGDPNLRIARLKWHETRLITVLAVRLSGFLQLFNTLSLEAAVKIEEEVRDLFGRVVERYGGQIHGLPADTMRVYFGTHKIYEDHAERAILTAFEMMEALKKFNQQHDKEITLQVGISSGQTIIRQVRTSAGVDYRIGGRVMKIAIELSAYAYQGEVWVDENTQHQAQTTFVFAPLNTVDLGPDVSLAAARVIPEQNPPSPPCKGPIIGREGQLAQLNLWWREALAGQGSLASITGAAGIGKTRLVYAFREMLFDQPHSWITAACRSYDGAISYGLLTRLIRGIAGIIPDDSEVIQRGKLITLAQNIDSPDQSQLQERLALLGQVIGLNFTAATVDNLEMEMRQWLLAKEVGHILAYRAAQQPLVIVLEDLQWADEPSLAVLSRLVCDLERNPVLLLATHRSDWAYEWDRRLEYHQLQLRELSQLDRVGLLANLLGVKTLPKAITEAILKQTGGNPFFIEEVITVLQEKQIIAQVDDAWVLTEDPAKSLPDTVEGVILARLSALPPVDYKVLQIASVIGEEFSYKLLKQITATLAIENLDQILGQLNRHKLIYYGGDRPPDMSYAFYHGLIRQVVYDHILEQNRRALHGLAAKAMKQLFGGDEEGVLERMAYHYYASHDQKEAIDYCLRAARHTIRAWANQTALNWYQRTLEVISNFELPGDENDTATLEQWRIEALVGKADVLSTLGQNDAAIAGYQQVLHLAATQKTLPVAQQADLYRKIANTYQNKGEFEPAQKAVAEGLNLVQGQECLEAGRLYVVLGILHYRYGRLEQGVGACRQSIVIIEQTNNRQDLAQAYNLLGVLYRNQGRSGEAIEAHNQSIQLYEQAAYSPGLMRAYTNIGCVYQDLSRWNEAEYYFQEAFALSNKIGMQWWRAAAANNLGEIYRARGDLDRAIEAYQQTRQIADEFDFSESAGMAIMNLGVVYLQKSQLAEADSFLTESLALLENIQADIYRPEILRHLAQLRIEQTHPDEGLRLGQEALDWSVKLGRQIEMGQAHRVIGQAYRQLLELEKAKTHLEQSLSICAEQGNLAEKGLTLLELACLSQTQNLPAEAIAYCDQAIEIFTQLNLPLDLQQAQQFRLAIKNW